MNFCSNCGQKVEGSNFCANCGIKIQHIEDDLQSIVSENVQFNINHPSNASQQGNSEVFLSNLFVEKDEQHISTFGNEQYIRFLNKGQAKKAFIILSNKRLYIRGKRYEMEQTGSISTDKRGKSTKTEKVIDMKDVKRLERGRIGETSSFFYLFSSTISTLLTIFLFGFTMYLMNIARTEGLEYAYIIPIPFLGAVIITVLLWSSYMLSIKSYISLLHNNNWIRFPLEKYVGREGYAFMKNIVKMQMTCSKETSEHSTKFSEDIIISEDGKLMIKDKVEEKVVDLTEITDMQVIRNSRKWWLIVIGLISYLFFYIAVGVMFSHTNFFQNVIIPIFYSTPVPVLLGFIFILTYLLTPPKALQLRVTCNNTSFTFPVKDVQSGADILRYIIKQQVLIEEGLVEDIHLEEENGTDIGQKSVQTEYDVTYVET
jgi:hypothetical protein